MALNSLQDLYVDQLQDIYSACKQSRGMTQKLSEAAHDRSLKDALDRGVEGIERGMDTLSEIIKAHGADPKGEHCQGMEGITREAQAHCIDEEFGDSDVQDAVIITQYQRMAHYAIAGYGCCLAFARRMEHSDDIPRLEECLEKSYDGDNVMTDLATSGINKAAA